MRFSILVETLRPLVKALAKVTVKHPRKLPGFVSQVLMIVQDNQLTLEACDLSVRLQVTTDKVGVEQPGCVLFTLNPFVEWLKTVPEGRLDFSLDATILRVNQGTLRFHIATSPVGEFPERSFNTPLRGLVTCDADPLREGLRHVNSAGADVAALIVRRAALDIRAQGDETLAATLEPEFTATFGPLACRATMPALAGLSRLLPFHQAVTLRFYRHILEVSWPGASVRLNIAAEEPGALALPTYTFYIAIEREQLLLALRRASYFAPTATLHIASDCATAITGIGEYGDVCTRLDVLYSLVPHDTQIVFPIKALLNILRIWACRRVKLYLGLNGALCLQDLDAQGVALTALFPVPELPRLSLEEREAQWDRDAEAAARVAWQYSWTACDHDTMVYIMARERAMRALGMSSLRYWDNPPPAARLLIGEPDVFFL